MSTTPVPADEQSVLSTLSQLFANRDQSISSLDDQLSTTQAQLAIVQQQLATVQADDTSVGAQLLTLLSRLQRLQMLADFGVALNLQNLPNTQDPNARPVNVWFQPSNTGNSVGQLAKPHGPWSITQNADGSATYQAQPAANNDNFFWANNLNKLLQTYRAFVQFTDIEITDDQLQPGALMAWERNFEQSTGAYRINAGLQALFGTDKDPATGALVTNVWRWYDIIAGHWSLTGVPLDRSKFGTGKRVQVASVFKPGATPAAGMTHVLLSVNGVISQINQTSKGLASAWGPYLQVGFQLDPIGKLPVSAIVHSDEAYWLI
jgi:hypothetical protein